MDFSSLNNALLSSLTEAANLFVVRMSQRVASNNLPRAIINGTTIKPAQLLGNGNASITIEIDAPMAGAFEFGSGLHDPDNPHLIPIKAINAPNLVFWWERGNKLFVGKQLPYGHPGVAPRPYIVPTMEEVKGEIAQMIGQKVTQTLYFGETFKVQV